MNELDKKFVEELIYVFGKDNVFISKNKLKVKTIEEHFYLFASIFNKYFDIHNSVFKYCEYTSSSEVQTDDDWPQCIEKFMIKVND